MNQCYGVATNEAHRLEINYPKITSGAPAGTNKRELSKVTRLDSAGMFQLQESCEHLMEESFMWGSEFIC